MNNAMIFNALPSDSKIWIYIADRNLTPTLQETVLQTLGSFFKTWKSHGRVVHGAARFWDDRFLCVGAYVDQGEISGCGIDDSVHKIAPMAQSLGFAWDSPLMVLFRNAENHIQAVPRIVFRKMVQEQKVGPETIVFNTGVTTVGELLGGAFELPLKDSWHARIFRLPAIVDG